MNKITRIDASRHSFDIHRDLCISAREYKPGPPPRVDGMTLGILTMTHDAPHRGEIHPDGDEILCVISGKLRVTGESAPDAPIELGPGNACIVPKGEWHLVNVLEKTHFIHLTPGPHGEHRPL